MDIEQLKLVLEAVNSTTGAAQNVAIYWFLVELAKYLISYSVGIAAIVVIYKVAHFITKSVAECSQKQSDAQKRAELAGRFEGQLREILIPEAAYGYVTEFERRDMLNKVEQLAKK